eukprot:1145010-Amphidinium_carterae.2
MDGVAHKIHFKTQNKKQNLIVMRRVHDMKQLLCVHKIPGASKFMCDALDLYVEKEKSLEELKEMKKRFLQDRALMLSTSGAKLKAAFPSMRLGPLL